MTAARSNLPPMPDLLTEQQRALLVAAAIEQVRTMRRSGPALDALQLDTEQLYHACWSHIVLDWSAARIGEALGVIAEPPPEAKGTNGARGRKKAAKKKATPGADRKAATALRNLKRALSVVRGRYRAILAEEIAKRGRELKTLTLLGDPTELLATNLAQLAANVGASLGDPEKFAALGAMEQHAVIRGFENIAAGVKTLADARLKNAQAEKTEAALAAINDKIDRSPKGTLTRKDLAEAFREAGLGKEMADALRQKREARE